MLGDFVVVFAGSLKILLRHLHFDQRSREATGVKLFKEIENVEVGALDELDLRHLQLALGVN